MSTLIVLLTGEVPDQTSALSDSSSSDPKSSSTELELLSPIQGLKIGSCALAEKQNLQLIRT